MEVGRVCGRCWNRVGLQVVEVVVSSCGGSMDGPSGRLVPSLGELLLFVPEGAAMLEWHQLVSIRVVGFICLFFFAENLEFRRYCLRDIMQHWSFSSGDRHLQ